MKATNIASVTIAIKYRMHTTEYKKDDKGNRIPARIDKWNNRSLTYEAKEETEVASGQKIFSGKKAESDVLKFLQGLKKSKEQMSRLKGEEVLLMVEIGSPETIQELRPLVTVAACDIVVSTFPVVYRKITEQHPSIKKVVTLLKPGTFLDMQTSETLTIDEVKAFACEVGDVAAVGNDFFLTNKFQVMRKKHVPEIPKAPVKEAKVIELNKATTPTKWQIAL